MTDHPLDLRPHEVRAAVDGRLSLIVRPLEPQPKWPDARLILIDKTRTAEDSPLAIFCWRSGRRLKVKLPLASKDRLWGREAWRVGAWHEGNEVVALDYVDGPRKEWLDVDGPDQLHRLIAQSREDARRANVKLSTKNYYEYTWPPGRGPTRWRPSDEMPRWASRLTLTVKDVAVKRVQEITEEETYATGHPITWDGRPYDPPPPNVDGWQGYGRSSFSLTYPDAWNRNLLCAFYSVTVHQHRHGRIER